jgi:nucleoside-diphosphate-sugar epimerase
MQPGGRLAAAGAQPVLADLDDRQQFGRIAGLADVVLHLAPPPGQGQQRYTNPQPAGRLGKGKSLPRCLIYVSTTGVYGDCGGAADRRNPAPEPESPRAGRRVDAEAACAPGAA